MRKPSIVCFAEENTGTKTFQGDIRYIRRKDQVSVKDFTKMIKKEINDKKSVNGLIKHTNGSNNSRLDYGIK